MRDNCVLVLVNSQRISKSWNKEKPSKIYLITKNTPIVGYMVIYNKLYLILVEHEDGQIMKSKLKQIWKPNNSRLPVLKLQDLPKLLILNVENKT